MMGKSGKLNYHMIQPEMCWALWQLFKLKIYMASLVIHVALQHPFQQLYCVNNPIGEMYYTCKMN